MILKHGSLFSGIGGFDLAAEWMGWENVFHCEWNEFGQKILKYYWPNAISYGDITQTDFTIHRGNIDIVTGGFPCQPYSAAGKRKGKEDERHLWPEMLRAIQEIQPTWIVGENVSGITNWNGGLVFNEVQSDLEAESYEILPFLLPACGVNAPHKRERVWFIAYSESYGNNRIGQLRDSEQQGDKEKIREGFRDKSIDNGKIQSTTNSNGRRLEERLCGFVEKSKANSDVNQLCNGFRWENFPTQSPIRGRNDGVSSELDGITISKHRKESVKAFGNAIVPQVVQQIFKAISKSQELAGQKKQ